MDELNNSTVLRIKTLSIVFLEVIKCKILQKHVFFLTAVHLFTKGLFKYKMSKNLTVKMNKIFGKLITPYKTNVV